LIKKNKKEKEFDLEEFVKKNKSDKKKYILEEAKKITPPGTIHTNLYDAYKNKEVINKFIKEYINLKNDTEDQIKENIVSKINKFKKNYIENKLPEKIATKKNSVFSMVGAEIFKSAQTISKSLSTSMGSLWEKIASCSNNVINTEEEFGIKITGVDAIALIDGKLTYIQLKTAEDTLTAGHSPRSVMELSIHDNSLFGTAFQTGSVWHFRSQNIDKFAGKDFWIKIDLEYDYIFEQVKPMILEIEKKYIELRDAKN
jgi:hypothetical protein